MNEDGQNDLENIEAQNSGQNEESQVAPTARNKVSSAIKNSLKNYTKAGGKAIGNGLKHAIVRIFTNPYVLIVLVVIIIAAAAYFIIKESFSNNTITSSKKSISQLAEADDADVQTKSLLSTYELNRSYLTATIKDINRIYDNYIEMAEEHNAAYSVEDMKREFGKDKVDIEEMYFESDPSRYFIPVNQRGKPSSGSSGGSSSKTTKVSTENLTGFLGVAKKVWQKVYSENYHYSYSAQPPYDNGVVDCSAYVSWVLAESGLDIGRKSTSGLITEDWASHGIEAIDVAAYENVINKLQPGDILVRGIGDGAAGHTNITVSVENGRVLAYDCGDEPNWLNSGGEPIDATTFASGQAYGSWLTPTYPGKIIRIGSGGASGSSSTKSSSSSSKTTSKVNMSSKINSSATTDKYPKEALAEYVLPSQKRELYKHILMTEKYNFNMINWDLYKAEGSGASRVLPSGPSDDIAYTIEPALGLRFPSSDKKTADYFVQLVEPYLQTNVIPLSMYSLALDHDRNDEKSGIARNAEFVYSIIKDAYSDITMNIYELEHYTENWTHEEWNVAEGNYKGNVTCNRVPNNLVSICQAKNSQAQAAADALARAAEEEARRAAEAAQQNQCADDDIACKVAQIMAGGASGINNSGQEASQQAQQVALEDCSKYDHNRLMTLSQQEINNMITALGAQNTVQYGYYNCHATTYEKNKETETITSSGNKTQDVLVSTDTKTDIEYKPYRVKAFDIVLEYEYNFEVYNTANQPDSVSTSSTELPDESITSNFNVLDSKYESEAYSLDCADGTCDGSFETIVGDYSDKVDKKRIDTTKNWNDKLKAASDGFKHRKYNFDDIKEYIADKEGKKVSNIRLSTLAENYYKSLDSSKKINRIDLINSTSKIYSSYVSNLQSVDKNLAIRQKDLDGNYSILTKRLREIQKDGVLPYIYGQTLGLNLKYVFEDDENANCNSSGSGAGYGGYEWPLPSNHLISALFGYTALYESTHEGIDMWATEKGEDKNVDVVAAKDGTVYIAEDRGIPSNKMLGSGGYGNHIIIYHEDDEKYTLYGHLETGTFKVKTGQKVKAGQVIAKTGSSGNSSAYHLHFNISSEPYSGCIDPLLYYNVEPTSSKYPEYSKLDRSKVTDFNPYKFVGLKVQNAGTTSLDGFLFIGDSRTHGIESQLKGLGNNITVIGIDSAKQSEFLNVVRNSGSAVQGQSVTLPSDVTGVSVALGVNEISSTGVMDELLDALLAKYPNKKIYVNSVFPVATTYTYGNASNLNSSINSFNDHIKKKCNSNTNLIYIDITNGLVESSGYLKSSYADSAGLHLSTDSAKQILVNNIKNKILNSNGKSSSSSDAVESENVNSVATEMAKVREVGTQTNLDGFKKFKDKYWDSITKWSDAYELDPYLILAILAHESGFGYADENYKDFRPQEGNSTVYGILQLTLWNGQNTWTNNEQDRNGNSIGTINVEKDLLGNADLQIRLCCAFLKNNLKLQGNQILPAIVAYNWGPNNPISVQTALSADYLVRIARCYDIKNSGSYSASLKTCIENTQAEEEKETETVTIKGNYVGSGVVRGNDTMNEAYFENAKGDKYYTYNQSNYEEEAWKNNGSGPTACAIVLSGLTGQAIEPKNLINMKSNLTPSLERILIPILNNRNIDTALYFKGKKKEGNYNGETISSKDVTYIQEVLAKGYPVIVYLKPGGTYNGVQYAGHYMALLGIRENGDVYIADPLRWGRDEWRNLTKFVSDGKVTAYVVCKKGDEK